MPERNKKGKLRGPGAPNAQTDDDFDDMLADVCAVDLAAVDSSSNNSSISTTTSSSSSSSVPEETIVKAIERGDINRLKQWARLGVE
jgi:hypothetical protein